MGTFHTLVAATVIAVAALPAVATDRYFPDKKVTSPGGKYRIEALSPHNVGQPRPFASDFTYTLYDAASGAKVWERKQGEGSPMSIYVDDAGWVVAYVTPNELIVLEPAAGKRTLVFNIIEEFPEAEREKYVHWTTAGMMWTGGSHWYFSRAEGRPYFVIRTGWGRHVVVDLQTAKVLREPARELLRAFQGVEVASTLQTLKVAAQRSDEYVASCGGPGLPEDLPAPHNLMAAIKIAADERLTDAIPHLRALENTHYIGSSGGWWDFDRKFKDGEIYPFNQSEYTIRKGAQYALRKLGEKPAEVPVTGFSYSGEGGGPVAIQKLPAPRADRVGLVERGAKPEDILAAIGAPDHLNFQAPAWEYDIDAPEPYTLRLTFAKDHRTIVAIERLSPPLWKTGERAEQIFGQ
jgi:hypothetical protein